MGTLILNRGNRCRSVTSFTLQVPYRRTKSYRSVCSRKESNIGNVRKNGILKRVRVTIVAVEK
jgi:hypothetical protein